MKIHEIPGDPGKKQKVKRVGRGEGSGLGKTSGKGNKGAQARTGTPKGGTFEGGQMPLSRRLPKRGFNNKRFGTDYETVNVSKLSSYFEANATIDPETLYAKKLVRKKDCKIKILGDGEIDKAVVIKAHKFSKSAIDKIKAKGGACEVIK